jgi:hypothetical protein
MKANPFAKEIAMQLNRNAGTAEVWDVPLKRRPVTPDQVGAYHARAEGVHAEGERDYAAWMAEDAVRSSKRISPRKRAAWLRRELIHCGPEAREAWRKHVVAKSAEERHRDILSTERSAPGVYVIVAANPPRRDLWVYVLGERGELLALTTAYGTDAHQAAAVNHAVAYYRSAVARRSAA